VPIADPNAPLCESCGYPLAGLSSGGECPECGRGIWRSLSSRRYGSRWQLAERGAWLSTCLDYLSRPREEFERLKGERRRSRGFMHRTTLIAAVLGTTPWAVLALAIVAGGGTPAPELRALTVLVASLCGTWLAIVLLGWMEAHAIRGYATRRGWRVTREMASAVCAHATVGWIVGGGVAALGTALAMLTWLFSGQGEFAVIMALAGLVAGAFVGLAWFQSLVCVGLGACKYANAPEVDIARVSEEPPAAPGRTAGAR
jgi:predicted RNA-binding Zn-ribbon protein involved in translation (DUF1610 family)